MTLSYGTMEGEGKKCLWRKRERKKKRGMGCSIASLREAGGEGKVIRSDGGKEKMRFFS